MNLCRCRNRGFSSHLLLFNLPANVFHLFYFKMCCLLFMENIGWWISVRDEQDKKCLSQSQHGLIALYGEHKCNMYICCIHINYIYNILHIKHILNLIIFLLFYTSQAVVFFVSYCSSGVKAVASMFFQWKKSRKKSF